MQVDARAEPGPFYGFRALPGQEKQHHPSDAPMPWMPWLSRLAIHIATAEEAKSDGGVYDFTIQYIVFI